MDLVSVIKNRITSDIHYKSGAYEKILQVANSKKSPSSVKLYGKHIVIKPINADHVEVFQIETGANNNTTIVQK